MLLKILGILDFIAGFLFLLDSFGGFLFINGLVVGFGIYILIKGLIFSLTGDFASIIDILCGIIMIISLAFTFPVAISLIVAIFLFQKAFFSFFAG
jgi:hypothetical protein